MQPLLSNVWSTLGQVWGAYQKMSQGDTMKALPPFGAPEWEKYCGLRIDNAPEIPPELLSAFESDCPIWPGKRANETHVLCLVPGNISFEDLRGLTGDTRIHPYSAQLQRSGPNAYWLLVTKEEIPGTAWKRYEDQEQKLETFHRKPPLVIEAMVAFLAAKWSGDVSLYSLHDHSVRCVERLPNGEPLVVHGGRGLNFCVTHEMSKICGMVGVMRAAH
jgi:hypothetical protein